MNSQIKDKQLTTQNDEDTKKHQAFAMELSRLKKAKTICDETKNCSEFNELGGNSRFNEIDPIVTRTREINHNEKKNAMEAGMENQFQKAKNGTEVSTPMVTKSSDHSGKSVTNKIMNNSDALQSKEKEQKIMTNAQALSEEISEMRYLIEYMNNNNKKQI
jgi:uncharacterized lipoprotein YehR (DUF1307 family)